MREIIIVSFGGAIGTAARYLLSGWALHRAIGWRFPIGTFLVNVIGCLVIGLLGGLVVKHELLSADIRVFLFTGVLGGFTTFSAFGLETFYLLRKGEVGIAAAYIALSVVVGLLVLWTGFQAAGSVVRQV